MRRAFTLIELLVVIAIIAIIAAIVFPVFARAVDASKKSDCLNNVVELSRASMLYTSDNDGAYPQSKPTTTNPEIDDLNGGFEEPDEGSVFDLLLPYTATARSGRTYSGLFKCPSDTDAFGRVCAELNPDAPNVNSYLVNGAFVFGLNESSVTQPASTIFLAERRSESVDGAPPYCDYMYRPWWNAQNPDAPEDEMRPRIGAVSNGRHAVTNYGFADGHAKSMNWTQTYSPPAINLHRVKQP